MERNVALYLGEITGRLQSVGNLRWQTDEPVSDLMRFQGSPVPRRSPGPLASPASASELRPVARQRIAKDPAGASASPWRSPTSPEDGEAVLVPGDRLLVLTQPLADGAEAVQGGGPRRRGRPAPGRWCGCPAGRRSPLRKRPSRS